MNRNNSGQTSGKSQMIIIVALIIVCFLLIGIVIIENQNKSDVPRIGNTTSILPQDSIPNDSVKTDSSALPQ